MLNVLDHWPASPRVLNFSFGKGGRYLASSQALRVSGGPGRLVSILGSGLVQGVLLVAPFSPARLS